MHCACNTTILQYYNITILILWGSLYWNFWNSTKYERKFLYSLWMIRSGHLKRALVLKGLSKGTRRAVQGQSRALGTQAFEVLRHLTGTRTLKVHLGTWTLKVQLDSQALKGHGTLFNRLSKWGLRVNPVQDGLFRGCSRMGGREAKRPSSLESATFILQWWNFVIHPLGSAYISIFYRQSANSAILEIQI